MAATWVQDWAWAFATGAWALWVLAAILLWVALFKDRSRGRRRCPKCWYDMTGVPGLKCPECGREAKREKRLFSTRRRWRLAAFGVALALVGITSHRAATALRHGVWAAVPIPVLNFVLGFWEEEAREIVEKSWQQTDWAYSLGPQRRRWPTPFTTWQRLIVASHIGRLASDPESPVTFFEEDWSPLGSESAVAVPGLERAATLGDRQGAVRVLLSIQPADRTGQVSNALDRLILSAAHEEDRAALMRNLGARSPNGVPPTRLLRAVVRDSTDEWVLTAAAEQLADALQAHSRHQKEWKRLLNNSRESVFAGCLSSVGRRRAAPGWVWLDTHAVALSHPSPLRRRLAVEAMIRGVDPKTIDPSDLADACRDVAAALSMEESHSVQVLMFALLADLRWFEPPAIEAARGILASSQSSQVRIAALEYLDKSATSEESAAEFLVACTRSEHVELVIVATRLLGRRGPPAASALDRIRELESSPDPRIAAAARAARQKIEVVPAE